ncbi:hypothetical protein KO500_12890 [Cellulophaga baltica]|uniref:tetratricopeptide repeat-containing sensor histidine kinase n=1 Tax=Cellulophaga TaxID=104264 RepID=UPI001C077E27|nr:MULTISPECIES: ATP-binding protein [Cellulophaga]MBU2997336.1 hypothetical protein [Cellulophaga baltica]MDO6768734.1 hypothetical protein [Cellulophaga sp. 1_MG-2023]
MSAVNSFYILNKPIDSPKIIKEKIKYFSKNKDYQNAINTSKKLLEYANKTADSSTINNAYWRQAFYFKKMNHLDSAYFYFDKSYKINIRLKDSIKAGDRLLDMANIQKSIGDYNGSIETAIDGLKYIENTENFFSIIGLYQTISVCQKELGNSKEALRWINKAINLLNNYNEVSKNTKFIIQNTKANILASQNHYAASHNILKKIANQTENINQTEYSRVISNMGYYMWLNDKNNKKSEDLLLNSFQIRKELNTISGLISSTIHLTEYYFETDKKEALKYAELAVKYSKKQKNSVALLEALDLLLPLKNYFNRDVSDEAILYSTTKNKLEKTKQAVRSIYVATKYDNDTLENKNLSLQTEVAKQQKENAIIFSIVLFLLIAIASTVYYKNQQKKKEQLETAYKTELRLSKKLHDELGNDIFYLMTQVQKDEINTDSSKKSMVLESLDTIYQRVRDISKEYTAIATDKNYGKEFIALLNSYSSNKTKIITKEIAVDFWNDVKPNAKIEVYRIIQELLVNMKKHSQASLIVITCTRKDKKITIKYVDNGIGFNKNEISLGNGLKNVENRIKAIKGNIILDSKLNKGLTATLIFTI